MEIFLLVFFFYSGYFYKPGKKAITKSIADRSKALAVPFFKYSLVFWGIGSIYLVLTKNETVKEAFACLCNFYIGCIWNRVIQDWFHLEYYSLEKRYFYLADFWFLIALFSVESVFLLVYRQNPDLKEKLLATGDANLIEGTTWKDKIWGVDLATTKGKNRLGKILMEVRETLKEKTGHSK